jgi:hypothetical protein
MRTSRAVPCPQCAKRPGRLRDRGPSAPCAPGPHLARSPKKPRKNNQPTAPQGVAFYLAFQPTPPRQPPPTAKLCSSAATKAILPSHPEPRSPRPGRPAPAHPSGRTSRLRQRLQPPAAGQAQRTTPSTRRRRFRCADKPLPPRRGAAFYLAVTPLSVLCSSRERRARVDRA